MRKIQVILLDDIDGSEAVRTVQFGIDGTSYEIDLNEANIEKLEKALAPFVEKATKVSRAASRGRGRAVGAQGRPKAADVRVWAKGQGIDVSERGRVPNSIIEQYEAAH